MATIQLTRGYVTIVDDDDLELVSKYRWVAVDGRPGIRPTALDDFGRYLVIHRLIMGYPKGKIVDHINRDTLDNRKCNLRITNRSGNARNSKRKKRTDGRVYISDFRGVSLAKDHKRRKRWRACIYVENKKRRHLGYFHTPEEAARVYDAVARELYGDLARLNFE